MKMDFETVYKQHYHYVYGVCLSFFRNREDAEDTAQNVFVILLKKLDQFEGRSQLTSWLYRVALNACLMKNRKLRNRMEIAVDYESLENIGDSYDPQSENTVDVQEAIKHLPPGYKKILKLHVVAGMTHEEIGEATNRSEGNSKSQFNKAKKRMRTLLEGY